MLSNRYLIAPLLVTLLWAPLQADRLRISPDDLRLRVAVSERLPASIRHELRSLASSTPLPLKDGLLQTEQLLRDEFQDRKWSEKRQTLVRYYFLVARLDQSQDFSHEFSRRRALLKLGKSILGEYIEELNRLIARAVYSQHPEIELAQVQDFPLSFVDQPEEGGFTILRQYPKAELGLGRENLRVIREHAVSERDEIQARIKKLDKAEKSFLAEVSTVGRELIVIRPLLRRWVKVPGEGLPFSR